MDEIWQNHRHRVIWSGNLLPLRIERQPNIIFGSFDGYSEILEHAMELNLES